MTAAIRWRTPWRRCSAKACLFLRPLNDELGYSRFAYMELMVSKNPVPWPQGLAHAIRAPGGVPRVVLTDNARPLMMGRDENGEP